MLWRERYKALPNTVFGKRINFRVVTQDTSDLVLYCFLILHPHFKSKRHALPALGCYTVIMRIQ